MTTMPQVAGATQAPHRRYAERPLGGVTFDLILALLSLWFLTGLYLDGWAHNNTTLEDDFFTPWHLVMYTGYLAVGLALVATQLRNTFRGRHWQQAVPLGYGLSLIGVVIFAFGGGFDFWWHDTFGTEVNDEALLSPAHLILATGALLFLTGPLRAGLARRNSVGWRQLLPVVLALLQVLSLFTFFTQYAHFVTRPFILTEPPTGAPTLPDLYGIMSVLVPTLLMMGIMLYARANWQLPLGAFTLIMTANSTMMYFMRISYVQEYPLLLLVGPIAGILADAFVQRWRGAKPNPQRLRLFAFVVPFVTFLAYIVLLNADAPSGDVWWTIHMWLGVPFLAGAAGLFMSFLTRADARGETVTGGQ